LRKVKELQHLSLATTYEVDNTFDSDKYIKMRLRVCHDGVNPNKSAFEVSDMENAKNSIKNIPILANVLFDENDQPQFGGHDMQLEPNKIKEGDYKLIYKEVPIGLIPETCNHQIDNFNDKNYVFVDGYVWKDYSNYAQDIIERDKDIKLSMEILVDGYSYNAKEKVYNITDYRYQGITFLNKDSGTGMENALATTETFEENIKQKFILMMEELKETLSNYDINIIEEGGSKVDEKIINLLSEYKLTKEELSFNIEEMTFEEVEAKLQELYGNTNTDNSDDDIKEPEKFVKSFELSHSEIRYALYQLLSPVESEDNEWYFIDQVYDDRFEYENWEGTKIFRQGYKKEDDNVSFDGSRIEVFQERLTQEEKDVLDKMRSNYSEILSEFEALKTKASEYETTIIEFETTVVNLTSEKDALFSENSKLQEFKSTVEFENKRIEIEGLIEDFESVLKDNEDFEQIKKDVAIDEKLVAIEYQVLEKELYALVGKVKYTKNNKPTKKPQVFSSKVSVIEESDINDSYYGDAVKYIKK